MQCTHQISPVAANREAQVTVILVTLLELCRSRGFAAAKEPHLPSHVSGVLNREMLLTPVYMFSIRILCVYHLANMAVTLATQYNTTADVSRSHLLSLGSIVSDKY